MIARISALASVGLLLLACGSEPKPPTAPTGGNETAAVAPQPQASNPKPDDNPTRSEINISDEIKKACGITDSEAYFAFDSASIRPQDHAVFGKLAKCFTDGPLKGREMRLVGHADNRGEEEYNMVLGEKRAANVKTAVVNEGMKTDKVATTSRGELDSTGTDEASWAKDRRVDVVLGD